MHPFTDRHGVTHELSLNGFTIERIRALVVFPDRTPVDLWEIGDEELGEGIESGQPTMLQRILSPRHRITFLQTLHACLGGDFESFAEAMDGEGLERATQAFLQEVINLFPSAKRGTLRQLLEQQRTLEAEMELQIQAANHLTLETTLAQLRDAGATPSPNTGGWADNFGSTPDPSPTDNSSTCAMPTPMIAGTTPPPSSP